MAIPRRRRKVVVGTLGLAVLALAVAAVLMVPHLYRDWRWRRLVENRSAREALVASEPAPATSVLVDLSAVLYAAAAGPDPEWVSLLAETYVPRGGTEWVEWLEDPRVAVRRTILAVLQAGSILPDEEARRGVLSLARDDSDPNVRSEARSVSIQLRTLPAAEWPKRPAPRPGPGAAFAGGPPDRRRAEGRTRDRGFRPRASSAFHGTVVAGESNGLEALFARLAGERFEGRPSSRLRSHRPSWPGRDSGAHAVASRRLAGSEGRRSGVPRHLPRRPVRSRV